MGSQVIGPLYLYGTLLRVFLRVIKYIFVRTPTVSSLNSIVYLYISILHWIICINFFYKSYINNYFIFYYFYCIFYHMHSICDYLISFVYWYIFVLSPCSLSVRCNPVLVTTFPK